MNNKSRLLHTCNAATIIIVLLSHNRLSRVITMNANVLCNAEL